ncbi:MAG: helix-turn-helix domain-containing protein [Erysipelotrichales bacterium]|nr:helix-turn-helix domain-containing protein [Erysipelotrichales bacterium]
MYYPKQMQYLLDQTLLQYVSYTEEIIESLQDFVLCFWEMKPKTLEVMNIRDVIVTDGCIDLVMNYKEKLVGFTGMSKTDFDFVINAPAEYYGIRLKPGAFEQLIGKPATEAMDSFIPLEKLKSDFDSIKFFSLSFVECKEYLKDYIQKLIYGKTPNKFVGLFDELSNKLPLTTKELYDLLNYSPRQCQRLFMQHFGLSPKLVISIIRFQQCLDILISEKSKEILEITNYYDQAHFINDFKKNMGLTPFEYMKKING